MYVAKIYIENNEDHNKTDLFKLQSLINALHNSAFKVKEDYKYAITLPELSNENMTFGNEVLVYSNSKIDLLEHLEKQEVKSVLSNLNYEILEVKDENIKFYISTFKRTYGKKATPSAVKKALKWLEDKKDCIFEEGTYNYKVKKLHEEGKTVEEIARALKGKYLTLMLDSKSSEMKYYVALDIELSDHASGSINDVDSNGFSKISKKVFLPYI